MKVIVCGAGQVGYNISEYLSNAGNDVIVIDTDGDLIKKITESMDVQGITGSGTHPHILAQAGADKAEMIIAVTPSDEVNMVACEVAHGLFDVPTKIARIRSGEYLNAQWRHLFQEENLSIDVIISPELEVARAISRSLRVPGAFEIMPFGGGAVKVIGLRCPKDCPLQKTPLKLLPSLHPTLDLTPVGLFRDGEFILPTEDDMILPEDEVYLVASANQIPLVMNAFGLHEKESESILIMGGGNIGLCLAQELESHHPNSHVKLIELNKERAEYISQKLIRSVVLLGDAFDHELLKEASIDRCERVIAVTEDDKVNILASLLAKSYGAQRAVSLINHPSYSDLVTSLGVDAVISPRSVTVSRILQHVRRGAIRSVYPLKEGVCEILEVEMGPTSPFIGRKVKDLMGKEVIVAVILRDDIVIHPLPTTTFQSEDRVIIAALRTAVKKLEKKLTPRSEY